MNLVVVLPWPPRLKALAETELKRCDVADNGQKWEQVCRRTAVNVVGEQAVLLHNIHHLLHPVAIEFVNIVVEELLRR